jgi:hypothetical protein
MFGSSQFQDGACRLRRSLLSDVCSQPDEKMYSFVPSGAAANVGGIRAVLPEASGRRPSPKVLSPKFSLL